MNKFQLPKKESNKIHSILKKPDGIIAFPTDTVWGIGCLVENEQAINRIYSIKGRPKDKPLILLGSKLEYLAPYVATIPQTAQKLIDKYFPGALTIILPKSNKTPLSITSGNDTIGIRIPNYLPLIELLDKAVDSHVLATTSANISGEKTSISKSDVQNSIGNNTDYIFNDYNIESKGIESTVVSVNHSGDIKILRQGAVIIDL